MTTIYTKPQIDAMAVKIGVKIKEAKTTVTPVAWGNITGNISDQLDLSELYYTRIEANVANQFLADALTYLTLNGAYYDTTTTAYPNVNIAADGALSRSTATFGTAATRDVGEAAGQVALVQYVQRAAYSKSPDYKEINAGYDLNNMVAGDVLLVEGIGNINAPPSIHPLLVETKASYSNGSLIQTAIAYNSPESYYRHKEVNTWSVWFPYSQQTTNYEDTTSDAPNVNADVSGKLRRSTQTMVTKDATGNLPVASIQAGIGAPKIAYKKLTGVNWINSTTIAHGLDASKILAISISYLSAGSYQTTHRDWDATYVRGLAIASNAPFKILITYEVD